MAEPAKAETVALRYVSKQLDDIKTDMRVMQKAVTQIAGAEIKITNLLEATKGNSEQITTLWDRHDKMKDELAQVTKDQAVNEGVGKVVRGNNQRLLWYLLGSLLTIILAIFGSNT